MLLLALPTRIFGLLPVYLQAQNSAGACLYRGRRSVRRALQLPGIDYHKTIAACQYTHGNNVVQPVVVRVARLKDLAQVQVAIGLCGSARLDEDVGTVICHEVVPCIG